MPNIALVPELKKQFERIIYFGSVNSMEEHICKNENIPYYPTETTKFYRREIWKNLTIPSRLRRGVKEAKEVLKKEKVSVVFSKGGYAALPTVLAARSLGIPVVCHESDRSLGLANRITARFADLLLTAFPIDKSNAEEMSTPIREKIFHGQRLDLFRNQKPTILFMGGSLGAEAINEIVSVAFADLTKRYNVLHIGGKGAVPMKTPSYVSVPFADDIENYFATADLIVSRGGASTLGELTALGKRVIVVPLPKGNSRGDQVQNAAYYLTKGLVKVLPQSELNEKTLLAAIENNITTRPPTPAYDRATPARIAERLYRIASTQRK